ncbi:MAG: hypothetical protein MZV65_21145 [Chromatiales bacterium]|nr:hypothetical protein [Chromatiales bacterium]
MAVKYGKGKVPRAEAPEADEDRILREAAARPLGEVERPSSESSAFHKALIAIWEFINVANKYIVEQGALDARQGPREQRPPRDGHLQPHGGPAAHRPYFDLPLHARHGAQDPRPDRPCGREGVQLRRHPQLGRDQARRAP